MQAEGEVVRLPTGHVEHGARFDTFVEEEHVRLFKALYFVTGSREEAEDLAQEAFLKLWERWDRIETIEDPTAYLFGVALNGFRMRRRRATMAIRGSPRHPSSATDIWRPRCARTCRRLLLEVTPRQRAALLLVDLLGYPAEQAASILRIRPSTVRNLVSQGRKTLRTTEGVGDA